MTELWKAITGFEDYEISNQGRVRSHKYGRTTILRTRKTHDGYLWYNLCKGGKQFGKRAHRLVAEMFIDNPENKPTVNHKDGNKENNSVDNLEWATRKEQLEHAYEHGLKLPMSGTKCWKSLLTETEVKEIRKIYKAHDKAYGMKALARKYNVSESTIDKCVRRESYKDIK